MKLRPIALAATLCLGAHALAWNAAGHMAIAAIARMNLSPKAKAEAERLLQTTSLNSSTDFVLVASWPDEIRNERRETGAWHYRDTYIRTDGKPAVDYPEPENVVTKIKEFTAILGDHGKSDLERSEALRFLIHFVGDFHQPLHAVARETDEEPKGDKGGNDFKIGTPFGGERGPKNLHSLWDGGVGIFPYVPRESAGTVAESQARLLTSLFPLDKTAGANDLDVEHWSAEDVDAAKKVVYNTPEGQVPSEAYLREGEALCAKRAALAGYRLAALLNKTLGQ